MIFDTMFSPPGLLAMALLGSVGETFDEIVRAVGFSSGKIYVYIFITSQFLPAPGYQAEVFLI